MKYLRIQRGSKRRYYENVLGLNYDNCILYEGLIHTYSVAHTITFIPNRNRTAFNIRWSVYDFNIDKLLQLLNTAGWFVSQQWVDLNDGSHIDGKFDKRWCIGGNYSKYEIGCEAKFDVEVDAKFIKRALFHVTDEKYLHKILQYGLVPKSKAKIADHPDRVYMCFDYSTLSAIAEHMISQKLLSNPVFLRIDIPKDNNIRLFIDPNAPNAVYTLNNIPPYWITQLNIKE
jgi:RNA:NAD 2'-phosphotransferase (TPT1/KptA family)